jgi:hypothetical protein
MPTLLPQPPSCYPFPWASSSFARLPASASLLANSLDDDAFCFFYQHPDTTLDKELSSRFARLRVRPAHRDHKLNTPRPEEWLLIEWPEDEDEPTKYWFSTLPVDTAFDKMVDIVKLRWRIERDYQELKQEVGLGHYEGRSWRGFHHHATLCIAAYGFLISERETFPPSRLAATTQLKKNLPFPTITDPAAPPIRPERHVENSIASMRRSIATALARILPRYPCYAVSYSMSLR